MCCRCVLSALCCGHRPPPVSELSHCTRDHVLSIVLWALGSQTVRWHSALDCTRRRAFSVLSSLCYCTALSTVLSTPCSTSVLSHCARHRVLWCSALDCDRRCALNYALWHCVLWHSARQCALTLSSRLCSRLCAIDSVLCAHGSGPWPFSRFYSHFCALDSCALNTGRL